MKQTRKWKKRRNDNTKVFYLNVSMTVLENKCNLSTTLGQRKFKGGEIGKTDTSYEAKG